MWNKIVKKSFHYCLKTDIFGQNKLYRDILGVYKGISGDFGCWGK